MEHHITMPSRGGTGLHDLRRKAVPWAADAIALEKVSSHTPSPGAKLRQGEGLWGPVQWCRECETVM